MASKNSTGFYVYVHKRATNGRVFYVGKGKCNRAHETRTRSQYWQRIASKHGHIVEIVQDNMQEWWAFELERELIALYGRESLCNMTDGGEGATGAKRSAETIAKHVAKHTGMKRSEESRKRMSDAQKISPKRDISGDKNPSKRPEVREKMRGERPHMRGDNNSMSNPETKAKLLLTIATKEYRKKVSDGVNRAYAESNLREKLSIAQKKRHSEIAKKVICIDTGRIFDNQTRAVEWIKSTINPRATSISFAINGRCKYAHGYRWAYA